MGSFAKFTLTFVVLVLTGLGVYLYFTGHFSPAASPAPPSNSSMAPLPSIPAVSTPASAPPSAMDNPPDLDGLNFPEVAIPGSELTIPGAPSAAPAGSNSYVAELTAHHLKLPIDHLQASQLYESFNDARGGSKHEATDIMEPVGTPVHAIDEGNLVKLFTSKKGGLTIYQFDDSRKYCYYYAHLDRYADNIKEGMLVRAGEIIGYVGSTGDANAASPHLHFAISLLDPDKKYWKGTPLDPYPLLVKVAGQSQ